MSVQQHVYGTRFARLLGQSGPVALVLVALFALSACEDETVNEQVVDAALAVDRGFALADAYDPYACNDARPCREGEYCTADGRCEVMTECNAERPCPSGQICTQDGVCVTQLRQCGEEMGCPEGQSCNDAGACRATPEPETECDDETPCPEGEVCDENGACVVEDVPDALPPDCCVDQGPPPVPLLTCDELECGEFEACIAGEEVDAECREIECVEDADCNSLAHFCDAGACAHDVCVPGSLRCGEEGIEMCAENGGGFVFEAMCGLDHPAVESACTDEGLGEPGCSCRDEWDCPAEQHCVAGRCRALAADCRLPRLDLSQSNVEAELTWGIDAQQPRAFGTSNQIMQTPVAAQLDDDNKDGLVDHRDFPDLVFVTRTSTRENSYAHTQNGILRAVRAGGPRAGEDIFAAMGATLWRSGNALPEEGRYPPATTPAILHPQTGLAVADLDDPVATDGEPEIVGFTESPHRIAIYSARGTLMAVSSEGVLESADVAVSRRYTAPAVTVANLDGVGAAEIILGRVVFTVERDAVGDLNIIDVFRGTSQNGVGYWGPVNCIGDVSGDERPEIIAAGSAYSFPRAPAGATRTDDCVENGGDIEPQGEEEEAYCRRELLTLWDARIEADGDLVVGQCAIGDVLGPDEGPTGPSNRPDGRKEVIIAASTSVLSIHDGETGLRREYKSHGMSSWGGVPQVGDFDGDGFLEVGLARSSGYSMIDFQEPRGRCPAWVTSVSDAVPDPAENGRRAPGGPECQRDQDCARGTGACNTVRGECVCMHSGWKRDVQGAVAFGATLFDFDRDGAQEVVIQDRCWLRIVSGVDGRLLWRRPLSSVSRYGRPIVADLDHDGSAEIAVFAEDSTLDAACPIRYERFADGRNFEEKTAAGVLWTFGEVNGRWASAPSNWPQYGVAPGRVTPDGVVPAVVPDSALGDAFELFGGVSPSRGIAGDLTLEDVTVTPENGGCGEIGERVRFTVKVRNVGDAPAAARTRVVFETVDEEGEPTPLARPDGTAVSAVLGQPLWPGEAITVSVTYDAAASPFADGELPAEVLVTVDPVGPARPEPDPNRGQLLATLPATPPPSDDPDVFENVPEAADYTLLYTLEIPGSPNFPQADIPYAVNNMVDWEGPIDRIAYYLTIQAEGEERAFVFISGEAFTQDVTSLGIPQTGIAWRRPFDDLQVVSNLPGIVESDGGNTGFLELWSNGYADDNNWNVTGASDATYDWGDNPSTSSAVGHGSFQVHNLTAQQVLLAFNRFNAAAPCAIGIGNNQLPYRGVMHPDWTVNYNCETKTLRHLQVLVRRGEVPYQPQVGDVRLVGGDGPHEGRVEVFDEFPAGDRVWGTVCDDGWGQVDADVVCRQLGYPGAVSARSSAAFGRGMGPIWVDDAGCTGDEEQLLDCPRAAAHNCGHNEDAGVVCATWDAICGDVDDACVGEDCPDPECDEGVLGSSVCCAASCGECGGDGCSRRPGGSEACCQGPIRDAGRSCRDHPAPCVMDAPIIACEPDGGVPDGGVDAGDAAAEDAASDAGDAEAFVDAALALDADPADPVEDAALEPEADAALEPDAEPLPPVDMPVRPATAVFGQILECSEDNNAVVVEIADPAPRVDLSLSDFWAQGARCPVAEMGVTVSNIGAVAAGDTILRVFAGDPQTGGRLLFEDHLPGPIEPGDAHEYQADIPAFLPYQPIQLYATLHSLDEAPECSVHDNLLSAPALVQCRLR